MGNRIICRHCGFSNTVGAQFCGNCAASLLSQAPPVTPHEGESIYCPNCEAPNLPEATFCGNCGHSLSAKGIDPVPIASPRTRCPHCGQINPFGATFCSECGQTITDSSAPPVGYLLPFVLLAGLVFLGTISLIALPRLGVPLPGVLAGLGVRSESTSTPRPEPTDIRPTDSAPSPVPPTDVPHTPIATVSPSALPTLTPFPTPTRLTPTSAPTPSPTATPDARPERIILGQTSRGTALEAIRFGNGPETVIFIGGMSAGFAPSTVALAEAAVDHFTRSPGLIPQNLTVFIVLSASPDAPVAPGNYSGRLNANGVDVNRNWDCQWAADTRWQGETKRGSGGTAPFSEAESRILRDLIQGENTVAVVFWQARAEGGLVSPGGCGETVEVSAALAGIYGLNAGYRVENFEDLTRQTLNGDASNYLDSIGIPAASVLLPNYSSSIDWQNNLNGIMAVLDSYAD